MAMLPMRNRRWLAQEASDNYVIGVGNGKEYRETYSVWIETESADAMLSQRRGCLPTEALEDRSG